MKRNVLLKLAVILGIAVFCFGCDGPTSSCDGPTFSPEQGVFSTGQSVTIVNNMADSTVYYTLDGTDPTSASIEYTGAISVSADTEIRATFIGAATSSEIVSAVYAIDSPPAPVGRTGQTLCYDEPGTEIACAGTGQDGDWQMVVPWPDPRFTDNIDGTVTDNLTGLVWLKDANRFGLKTWTEALSDCNSLADDGVDLTDDSIAGDWRLPNRFELESLLDLSNDNPAFPTDHPFADVQSYYYWSSTTYEFHTNFAWYVLMLDGAVNGSYKDGGYYVWPVRSDN
jgi:hypothetical protein